MKEGIEERLLKLLEEGLVTPNGVASKLRIAWATAQAHSLKLVGEGKVSISRKGRVNVYFRKAPKRLTFNAPSWAKSKS